MILGRVPFCSASLHSQSAERPAEDILWIVEPLGNGSTRWTRLGFAQLVHVAQGWYVTQREPTNSGVLDYPKCGSLAQPHFWNQEVINIRCTNCNSRHPGT